MSSGERAGVLRLRALVEATAVHGPSVALTLTGDVSGVRAGGPPTPPGVEPERDRVRGLVRLAQQGDSEAFAQLYDLYVDGVYRYLYFRLGTAALAEDLTSETFLRALRRIDTFSWQGKDIGAWFITIARNLVTDHLKSSRFRLEVTTADMLAVDVPADGAASRVEATVLAQLEQAALVDALRKLKPEQLECVVLRFLHGLSVAETAQSMGRSEGAVKQLQLRGLRALAAMLVPKKSSVTSPAPGRSPGREGGRDATEGGGVQ
jgi:RNA polymerase sigma-70 factor (ECF subfamily)